MSMWKRFLLLGSLCLTLLAGLTFTSITLGSHTASAASCDSPAKGDWSNNCQTSDGNQSNYVIAIQTVITYSGTSHSGAKCTTKGIDGIFGANTLAGIICFQGAKGLSQDGIVGPKTWTALNNVLKCVQINNVTLGCHLPTNSSILFEEQLNNGGTWIVSFKGSFCSMVDNSLC